MALVKKHWTSVFAGSSRPKRDDNPTTKKGQEKQTSGVKKSKRNGPKPTYRAPRDDRPSSTPASAELSIESVQLPKLVDLLDVTVALPPPAAPGPPETVDLDPAFSALREDFRQYQDGTAGSESRDEQRVSDLFKSFEKLERSRADEKRHHQEIETRLEAQLQASRERFITFEREMQRAMQSEVEKNLLYVFDQLQAAKLAEQKSHAQILLLQREEGNLRERVESVTKDWRSEVKGKAELRRQIAVLQDAQEREFKRKFSKLDSRFSEEKAKLDQNLDKERQRNDLLLVENNKLKKELIHKEQKAKAELENERIRYQELERSTRIPQGPSALEKKKQELQAKVGAPVAVRHIGKWGGLTDGDLDKLTPAMLVQMKTVTAQFAKIHPVIKIEYILNNNLYKQYEDTRSKFKKQGRGSKEILVFHGTDVKNINPYFPLVSF
jgi:hypothetical protein